MKKKKNCNSGSVIIAIVALVIILLMVLIVNLSLSKGCHVPRPNIVVSIDKNGNVYDGQDRLVGKLADPNIKFYDDSGHLLGQAIFDMISIN